MYLSEVSRDALAVAVVVDDVADAAHPAIVARHVLAAGPVAPVAGAQCLDALHADADRDPPLVAAAAAERGDPIGHLAPIRLTVERWSGLQQVRLPQVR